MSFQHCRVDTYAHPSLRVYSAGNFGEIAPKRLSPMSWSLVGRPMELGTRRFITDILGAQRWATGSNYVFTGYFGCRPYHNLTAYCQIAEHVNLLTPQDVTAAYFEGITPPASALAHRPGPLRRNSATARMLRELVELRPRVIELEQQVFDFEQEVEAVLTGETTWRVGELAAHGNTLLERAWHLHIIGTSGSIAAEVLQRNVIGRLVRGGNRITNWLKEPAELPWGRIAELAPIPGGPSQFVERPFYEIADTALPWADFVIPPMGQSPAAAREEPDLSPREALIGMGGRWRGAGIDATVLFLGDVMALREHSKSLAMRLLHAHRRFVPVLAELRGLGAADWPYLSMSELRGTPPDRTEIEARRESCEDALAVDMPDYLDLSPGAPEEFQPTRAPRGVSAGVCDGIAIGLGEMPTARGAVLACESADANVLPILPYVGAVVTARGSQYSHIAIICRELGIPAVVSHPLAADIKPGQRVYVNGDTGEVRIVH
ncbi:PEP-utilizing enzyme [Nocardia jejuensis]|uniref:PEP-utilizing enzyme n=1 Tax=Nocardia jejuensis TaxID=328049 RepID=UPI00082EBCA5|nr:PEP-utilizing enzyme [Nocardia jejuensis]